MAADRLCDDNGTKTYVKKIVRVNNEIIGLAGNICDFHKFLKWYEHKDEDLEDVFEESEFIVLNDQGIFTYESPFPIQHLEDRGHYSIGSGQKFALSAMDLGYTPEDAVKYARERDTGTGGRVDILWLDDQK